MYFSFKDVATVLLVIIRTAIIMTTVKVIKVYVIFKCIECACVGTK